jgi:CMP-N-acetylneuraminic acid synthetase
MRNLKEHKMQSLPKKNRNNSTINIAQIKVFIEKQFFYIVEEQIFYIHAVSQWLNL